METLLQDVRYGFRTLFKSPVFTLVAVLTLALGIGANTAIFTLINAVLLKMLPIQHPEQLVTIGDPARVDSRSLGTPQTNLFSYPLYRELRDGTSVFSGMYAAGTSHRVTVQKENQPSPDTGARVGRLVTGNYFSVLGAEAAVGRLLTPEDDKVQHGHPVAVISYAYWKSGFSLSPSIVGHTLRLNGFPFTIIGVTRPGFFGDVVGEDMDIFMPLAMQSEVIRGRDWYQDRNASWLQIVARLKPGISVAQARANVNVAFKQILTGSFGAALTPDDLKAIQKNKIDVTPGGRGLSRVRGDYEIPLLVLMTIVALVLLIACVNVANLLLARASSRKKEVAVRLAVGASPGRIIRQLLTESLLLAILGGVVGSLFALWGVGILVKMFDAELPTSPDLRMFAFTTIVCVLTGIIFGLVPAIRATRTSVSPALKEVQVAGGDSRSRWTWGKGLIVAQVALSLSVLFAAGLLLRSLRNLQTVDLGYSQDHLLLVRLDPTSEGYEIPQIANLGHELLDKITSLPGVRAVTLSENGLFSGTESADDLLVPGFNPLSDADKNTASDLVGPNYFSSLGVPILMGREIGLQDLPSSPRVAVINQAMANFYFKGQNPIGRKFYVDDVKRRDQPIEVVGVVRDSKQNSLRKPDGRRFYEAFFQKTDRKLIINLEIRTAGDPTAVAADLRKQIQSIDVSLPVDSLHSISDLVDSEIGDQIALAKLSGSFALLGLILACVGLYGIMSYTVSSRTREIGLRMALGAQHTDVLWLVLREALTLASLGIVVGVPSAMAGSTLISTFLFGVKPSDPFALVVVTSTLACVAVLASYIPARRAAKVDPMVALRNE